MNYAECRNTVTQLYDEMHLLERQLDQLIILLHSSATELEQGKLIPGSELQSAIGDCQNGFVSLKSRALALSEQLGERALPSDYQTDTKSAAELRRLLEFLNAVCMELDNTTTLRDAAFLIIDKAARIHHVDRVDFEPLLNFKRAIEALRTSTSEVALPDLHPEVSQINAGEHPVVHLLSLIENGPKLDDEQCELLSFSVREAYSSHLATAALRGKLIVGEENPPPIPAAEVGSISPPEARDVDETVSELTFLGTSIQVSATEPEAVVYLEDTMTGAADPEDSADTSKTERDELDLREQSEDEAPAAAKEVSSDVREIEETPQIRVEETIAVAIIDAGNSADAQHTEVDLDVDRGNLSSESKGLGGNVGGPSPVLGVFSFDSFDAQSLAREIIESQRTDSPEALDALAWKLLQQERFGLAYHLLRTIGERAGATQSIPAEAVHAFCLGQYVVSDNETYASSLAQDFAHLAPSILDTRGRDSTNGIAMMVCGASLRPALLAPNCGVQEVLEAYVDRDLPELDDIPQLRTALATINEFCRYRNSIDPILLRAVADESSWAVALKRLLDEASAWRANAPYRTTAFARATHTWSRWLRQGGLIARLVDPVIANEVKRLDAIRGECQRLRNPQEFDRELDNEAKRLPGYKAGERIGYAAHAQIWQSTDQAITLAERWIALYDAKPGNDASFLQDQARKLHANVFQIQAAISSELAGQMTLDCPYQVRIGAACFEKAYTRLCKTVFSEQWQDTSIEPDIELVFDGELLGVPEIDFTPEWDQRIPNDILRKAILNLVAEGEIDWLRAYDLYADQASHVASGLLLRYLLFINAPTEMTEQIARRRQDDIGEATERLERAAKVALQEVEEAAAYSQLYEGERNHYVAEIERVRKEVNRIPDFRNALSNIAAIREQLNGKRNEAVAKVQRRMVEHRIDQTHEAFQRISKVLETGDFLSANEYIEKVIAGVALPEEATTTDHFTSFFPAKMKEIERFLDPRTFSVKKVLRDLTAEGRHGYRLGPIDMTRVQGAQADQVVKALKSWELLRSQNVYANTVIEVFRFLGFVSPRVILEKQPSNWADLTTEPLNNRDLCPVRQYGSDSAGKYRVLLISGNPSAEDIVNSIPDTPSRTPTIVLHFNQIAEEKRRELAAISRHRRKMFIVIDETLLYFLCGFKSPRLRIMFECTLPFTLLDPYTTTAGIVPPEVFFGRRKERELIIDPMGSCFIYGGRQLGKTALLRDVERTYHDLAKGHIVSWLDLKVEGIGLDRDIEDIWYLIARELKRHGLLPSSITPGQIGTERLAEYVEGWLAQDEQRRVLFLLDEADTFLEADASNSGKEFLHSQRLKGLMDRTNRRFKAVFAGLHNVQRTTRHGNHPLAHYGTPICIGPLLDNGEWRAATGLVHDPLASAGYRFESPDLITRILSQTNYYPSLIQLYCAELVGHLTNPNDTNFDRKTSPPYQIANRHVADVYRNEDFRQGIRQRFNWTLQLDTRYEVIAYSIAHATLDDKSPDVFSIDWIRSEAIYWWPEGFEDSASIDTFRALADEMVGLGILRDVGLDSYALRSPNITLLLGRQEDVERELLRQREPNVKPDSNTFRAIYRTFDEGGSKVDQTRRSPMTSQQESVVRARENGVTVIFGCEAAGIGEVDRFLVSAFGLENVLPAASASNQLEFGRIFDELAHKKRSDFTLVWVPANAPWTSSWVAEALEQLNRYKSRRQIVRVAFSANPSTAWQLIHSEHDSMIGNRKAGVSTVHLQPWHDSALRLWLEDNGFGIHSPSDRQLIREYTGNWPALLYEFHKNSTKAKTEWLRSLAAVEDSIINPDHAAASNRMFGLSPESARTRVLAALSERGQATSDTISAALTDIDNELVRQALQWADSLNLITSLGKDLWKIDGIVGKVLASHSRTKA